MLVAKLPYAITELKLSNKPLGDITMSHKFKRTEHFPFAFYRLPLATQVVFLRMRDLADKFAYIDTKKCEIRFHERSNPKKLKIINRTEARRIFFELYPERVESLELA